MLPPHEPPEPRVTLVELPECEHFGLIDPTLGGLATGTELHCSRCLKIKIIDAGSPTR